MHSKKLRELVFDWLCYFGAFCYFKALACSGVAYVISGVFGLPGSGKSMLLAGCADSALKKKPFRIGRNILHTGKYNHVLTNFPMLGCAQLDFDTLGKYNITDSLILIDEIMMYADSRNFKTFSDDLKFFFSQHRKMNLDIIWTSQNYDDSDKKIRGLTDKYFYCRRMAIPEFSIVTPINSYLRVEQGKISSGYELDCLLMSKILYLPKYWNLIDSYQIIGKESLIEYQYKNW